MDCESGVSSLFFFVFRIFESVVIALRHASPHTSSKYFFPGKEILQKSRGEKTWLDIHTRNYSERVCSSFRFLAVSLTLKGFSNRRNRRNPVAIRLVSGPSDGATIFEGGAIFASVAVTACVRQESDTESVVRESFPKDPLTPRSAPDPQSLSRAKTDARVRSHSKASLQFKIPRAAGRLA